MAELMKYTIFEILDLAWIPVFFGIAGAPVEQPECHSYLMTTTAQTQCGIRLNRPVKKHPPPVHLDAWDLNLARVFPGSVLEALDPACTDLSIRWNHPVADFDINADGINDILLPVSCYQGEEPGISVPHNRSVVGAWLMFCSSAQGHYNCTSELFDAPSIRVTGDDPWGGNPYTQVMATPSDLNGDGHPDFWYALNRDDGRMGIDPDDPILFELCGTPEHNDYEWDCTRKSVQSVILSTENDQGELKYQVVQIPWGPRLTQAMAALPNHLGGYDVFAFNYGEWKTARIHADNTVTDVSAEYQNYLNMDVVMYTQPYVYTFDHQDDHYLITAEINMAVLQDPYNTQWQEIPGLAPDIFQNRGFSLWRWQPGVGFHLSDTYAPDPADTFVYTEDFGGQLVEHPGAWVQDIPVFFPKWHFFQFAQLHPGEDPVLVTVQEAVTLAGNHFGTQPRSDLIYTQDLEPPADLRTHLVQLNVVQGFYIYDGKIIPRQKSVVEGDVVWNTHRLQFADLDADGFTDMYAPGNHAQNGQVFLNNGTGMLYKTATSEAFPDINAGTPHPHQGMILDLGDAPYLSVLYWGNGQMRKPELGPEPFETPMLGIVPGLVPIDRFPRQSPGTVIHAVGQCQKDRVWMGHCRID